MYRLLALPTLLTAAAWALLSTTVAQADPVGRLAEISVYDATFGRTLPVYERGGRYYIAGTPGNEYRVQVNNRSGTDILAVMSVDGVNVLNGADANWGQAGYVLYNGQSYAVDGWRTSQREVAAFYFTTLKDSYAARTGRAANLGVIGVAVFRRKPPPAAKNMWPGVLGGMGPRTRYYGEADSMAQRLKDAESPPAPAAALPADKFEAQSRGQVQAQAKLQADAARRDEMESRAPEASPLGTGYGRSQLSPVHDVDFERASPTPDEVITIYYDSYDRLIAQGIIPAPVHMAGPDPFPGRFVPPPPR